MNSTILSFMRQVLELEDRLPSTREIAARFKCSQTTVVNNLKELEAAGEIERRTAPLHSGSWYRFTRKKGTAHV
jgi:DNA-binding transcriptional regulator YhcF (GntR family)